MLSNRIYENHRTRIPLVIHIYWGEGKFSFINYSPFCIHLPKKKVEKIPDLFMVVFVTDQIQSPCTRKNNIKNETCGKGNL
jgi:hypothetical protein